jgi:hypothetical protein
MREEKAAQLVNRGRGHPGQVNKEFLVSASRCQYETFCIETIGAQKGRNSFLQTRQRLVVLKDYLNMALISR